MLRHYVPAPTSAKPTDLFHHITEPPAQTAETHFPGKGDDRVKLIYIAGRCDEPIDTKRLNFAVYACAWGPPKNDPAGDRHCVCFLKADKGEHAEHLAQLRAAIVGLEYAERCWVKGDGDEVREVRVAYSGNWFRNQVVRRRKPVEMEEAGKEKDFMLELKGLVRDIEEGANVVISFWQVHADDNLADACAVERLKTPSWMDDAVMGLLRICG